LIIINNQISVFNSKADSWDQEARRVKLASDVGDAIAKAVSLDSSMDALDFGCGTGLLTLKLQPFVHSIMGVDSSSGMIGVLNEKIKDAEFTNVKTECLDLATGDILDGQYSLIVSSMVFHHIKNIEHLLETLYKALSPGGFICIADLDSEDGQFHDSNDGVFHLGFDRAALRELFFKAGFVGVKAFSAATLTKITSEGQNREFGVFLMVGCKKA